MPSATNPLRVPGWGIFLVVAATFGSGMAMIVPMAYSLAVRIEQLAPGRTDLLGLLLGVGSAATLVVAPLSGILSDRTRSRWGRRRPFAVVGAMLGIASAPVMALAPDVSWLAVGWVLSTVGWNIAGGSIGNWQADHLPIEQRGKVSGMAGLAMQVSPVIGILLVSVVREDTLIVFVLPAIVALVTIAAFVVLAPDPDSRQAHVDGPLTLRTVLRSYTFRPADDPDFSWNWLGRFIFFLGLTMTTSFTVYFYAQRLILEVADVAAVLAATSLLSLTTATIGSLGAGWFSDRIRRRRPVVMVGAALFAGGAVVSAFAMGLPAIVLGTLVSSLGIAVFSAAGQALSLDVLPHRETQAGRFMAIALFSQKIPGVIAPLAASVLLLLGDSAQNFSALYLAAAALAIAGGTVILLGVRGAR